jgi:carboxybiotin decarboxylase
MDFLNGFMGVINSSGFVAFSRGNVIMILVGLVLLFLAIKFKFEPLLLIPIAIGCILVNLPLSTIGITGHEIGFLGQIFNALTATEILPIIMFLCLGALTDFTPLLARPVTFILGAAAQFGVFMALFLAIGFGFSPQESAAIAIIGGADGPTSIFLATKMAPQLIGAISVAAYSYMSLVPIILPPIIRALTTEKERKIRMETPKPVSKTTKILFPIVVAIIVGLILPSAIPLIGMLMAGNLIRESGVVERLSKTLQNELVNMATVFLGLTVGSTMVAGDFLTPATLKIILLGLIAFAFGAAGGTLMGKLMCKLSGGKINPMIGAAGVSAVPMSARTVQIEGQKYDKGNYLLMSAMGPNVAGVIGTAVAAGVFLALFM